MNTLNLKTWPERIYLQSENEHGTGVCKFKTQHEVTWCQDQISAHDVEYVRADVARAQPVAAIPEATDLLQFITANRDSAMSMMEFQKQVKAKLASLPAIPEAGQSVAKLTDAQICEIASESGDGLGLLAPVKFARAIESAVIASMSADAEKGGAS